MLHNATISWNHIELAFWNLLIELLTALKPVKQTICSAHQFLTRNEFMDLIIKGVVASIVMFILVFVIAVWIVFGFHMFILYS